MTGLPKKFSRKKILKQIKKDFGQYRLLRPLASTSDSRTPCDKRLTLSRNSL